MNAFGPEWTWAEGVPATTTVRTNRAKKLRALGNALVPQVAYQIFRAIEDES